MRVTAVRSQRGAAEVLGVDVGTVSRDLDPVPNGTDGTNTDQKNEGFEVDDVPNGTVETQPEIEDSKSEISEETLQQNAELAARNYALEIADGQRCW